jgi:hypothetical protein
MKTEHILPMKQKNICMFWKNNSHRGTTFPADAEGEEDGRLCQKY